MEKMMSICLTWFPISVLGEPELYHQMIFFTRIGDFTWRVSDWWRHLRKHLGGNVTNYFMYDSWGLCPSLPLTPQALPTHTSQPSQCITPHL